MLRRTFLPFLIVSGTVVGCGGPPAPPPPMKTPEVEVTRAIEDEVTDYEEFQGKTEAEKAVDIRARVSGYLDHFDFKEGELVPLNKVLFVVDQRPFKAELERTIANVGQVEAHLKRLQYDFARAEQLLPKGSISREDYDKAAGDLAEARAAYKASVAARDIAQLNLDYSEVRTPVAGRISRRFVDPGNMVKADDTILTRVVSLDPMYVYFDIDERTHLRLQHLQERRAAVLAAHFAMQPLVAEGLAGHLAAFALFEPEVLARQMKVTVTMALADEKAFPRKGTVDFVDNRVDPDSGSVWVRGVFPNPGKLLTPGLFVRVRLPVGESHRSVMIPEEALATDQGKKFVWVVDSEDHAHYTHVTLGAQHGKRRALLDTSGEKTVTEDVREGVKAGERVIVSGLQRVRADPVKHYAEVKVLKDKEMPPKED